MIRKRILLASFLKPVTDTRLYEKLGKSLAKLPQAEVHVAGFAAALPPENESLDLTLHPVFHFKRLSWGRVKAQKAYWKLLNQLKPHLIIVGTHELLVVSWLYARRHQAKLIYDVQENYFLNLTTQGIYRPGLRQLMGFSIRSLENLVSRSIDHFFLAERSYAQELPFLHGNYTVLQNKFAPPTTYSMLHRKFPVQLGIKAPLRLLYSGTISKVYGVTEAITFTQQLRKWVPSAELTIVGYCADAGFLKELKSTIQLLPFIYLIGGDKMVPHQQILEHQKKHHVGLLPYQPHPSTIHCVPTKLFEYQAQGLVVVIHQNPLWEEELLKYNSGLAHDFTQPLTALIVEKLLKQSFYQSGIPKEVFWLEEENQVQHVILNLLAKPSP